MTRNNLSALIGRRGFAARTDAMLSSFIRKHAGHYNVGEFSVLFALFAVVAFIVVGLAGVNLVELFAWPDKVVFAICLTVWLSFVGWLGRAIVVVGRKYAPHRATPRDLKALLILSVGQVAGAAYDTALAGSLTWQNAADAYSCVMVALFIIYFALAIAMRVQVPRQACVLAAVVMGLAVWRWL
jgi:hypothetical protein